MDFARSLAARADAEEGVAGRQGWSQDPARHPSGSIFTLDIACLAQPSSAVGGSELGSSLQIQLCCPPLAKSQSDVPGHLMEKGPARVDGPRFMGRGSHCL